MYYVVAYDIPDDRRRTKLHKSLRAFGLAIQRSVFQCSLDEREHRRMIKIITDTIEPAQDRVRVFLLCASCHKAALVLGPGDAYEEPDVIVI